MKRPRCQRVSFLRSLSLQRTTLSGLLLVGLGTTTAFASGDGSGAQPAESKAAAGGGSPALGFADYDGDGRLDAFVAGAPGAVKLLRQGADGTFEDVTVRAGLGDVDAARGALWRDVDGDQDLDFVALSASGVPALLENCGSDCFAALAGALGWTSSDGEVLDLRWLDVDVDGLADLHASTSSGEELWHNLDGRAFQRVKLAPIALVARLGAVLDPGSTLAATLGGVGSIGPGAPAAAAGICAATIVDQATSACIDASSAPLLGSLYPLSAHLNVNSAGNVGMGTTNPGQKLDVIGTVRASGRLLSTATGVAPLGVTSAVKVDNLNADLVDGLDAAAFSQLGNSIESTEITDGTLTDLEVAANAAIAGTKITPDFGTQQLETDGIAVVGTSGQGQAQLFVRGEAVIGDNLRIELPDGPGPFGTGGLVVFHPHDPAEPFIKLGHGTHTWTFQHRGIASNGLSITDGSSSAPDLHVTSDGKLGVNVSSPQAAAHIVGNAGTLRLEGTDHTFVQFFPDGPTTGKGRIGFLGASENHLTLANDITGAHIQLVPGTGGGVGIGTNAPESLLHVLGSSPGAITPSSEATLVLERSGRNFLQILGSANTDRGIIFGDPTSSANGLLSFGSSLVPNGFEFKLNNASSTKMAITSSGSVGVGTITPESTLHVHKGTAGSVTANAGSSVVLESNTSNYVSVLAPSTSEKGILFGDPTSPENGGIVFDNTATPEGLQFRTGSNSTKMVIQSDGDVGIGTINPAADLQIVGSPTLATLMISPNEPNFNQSAELVLAEDIDASFGFVIHNDGVANELQIHRVGAPPTAGLVITDTGGQLGIGRSPTSNNLEVAGTASKSAAGSWLANSDRRIKQDVATVTGALDTLDELRVVSFRYTDEYRQTHPEIADIGYFNVIAQEFAEVFPDYVKSSGEGDILQVDTYPMLMHAVAAIGELRAQKDAEVRGLQSRVAELEDRLTKLEARLGN